MTPLKWNEDAFLSVAPLAMVPLTSPTMMVGAAAGELGIAATGSAAAADTGLGRVFWSGDEAAMNAAARWANATGGTTLEMTPGVQGVLPQPGVPPSLEVTPILNAASRDFAAGARGPVDVFLGQVPRANSTWNVIERPALQANPNVTRIRYHLTVIQ